MQQFKGKLRSHRKVTKNTPTDAPQVCSSVSTSLNRDENLSEMSKVLPLNSLDVDQSQHIGRRELPVKVYVLNMEGKPLMPCSPAKAKHMLKKGEAHIVKGKHFFTIQLDKPCGDRTQRCYLGNDPGTRNGIGYSARTDKKELLSIELKLDTKTSERLAERRMYRRNRRSKLWYRKPRFNNRVKPENWLPSSIQRFFDTQKKILDEILTILPISEEDFTIEKTNFDIQKIENPDIQGVEYQQGPLYNYQNMRAFLMAREQGKCQLCGKEFNKGNGVHIHHIIPRSWDGTDREKNLAILHKKCHDKLHRQKLFNKLKKNKTYKDDATIMNIISKRLIEAYPKAQITYGYITSTKRKELGMEKSHYNDAFVISGGTGQERVKPIVLKQKHRNNRAFQLNRKGFGISIRRQRYSIQPGDLAWVKGKKYSVKGSHNHGEWIQYFDNKEVKEINIKKIEKVFHTKSIYKN